MNAVDPGTGNVHAKVEGRSLWAMVPSTLRLELIPLASTAALVQNGRSTAEALTRLRNAVFGGEVKPVGLDDLTGLFLLLNFAILLWFAHRTLNEALEKAGEPTLSAKLIGLSTGFLTITELYSYALKTGHPERRARLRRGTRRGPLPGRLLREARARRGRHQPGAQPERRGRLLARPQDDARRRHQARSSARRLRQAPLDLLSA